MARNKVVIIGAGFAGLSAAAHLAKAGMDVTVVERHEQAGGRARSFKAEGFSFDMGPSWYWMPDVFERFFSHFSTTVSAHYKLVRLDPSYRVYWPEGEAWDIPASYPALQEMLERYEPGAAASLDKVMAEAEYKYRVGMQKLVYKPGQSVLEFADAELLRGLLRLDVFNNIRSHFARHFRHPHIRALLEFPSLFLGALPQHTPALYSLMNYADIKGGTWYPMGGMHQIAVAMRSVAEKEGARFHFEHDVFQIEIIDRRASKVHARTKEGEHVRFEADIVVSDADYHFTETKLLASEYRNYSEAYWNKRVMAPTCLIFYLGINKKIPGLKHHTLFFDTSFDEHAKDIYSQPKWPALPLFYASATSVTDKTQAPAGNENLFFLVPLAAGINGDTEALRQNYLQQLLVRFEQRTGCNIADHIVYQRSYCVSDFSTDYNAFKGNAYGLANTLMQTAILKPSARSRKVNNLFYTGQLTVPGPGVPPAIISGEVIANLVTKHFE